MPDVSGIQLENARLMLRNAGFQAERIQLLYEEAYRPEDEIVRQEPGPGSWVAVSEPIQLSVSRQSLLHYLPQAFHKTGPSGEHFLREFLWIFHHTFADLERTLNKLHLHFDPLETPLEFLPWLASWVALSIDQEWPEPKKRRLIQQAIGMYSLRGTVQGLKIFLHIFTGVEPKIMENRWPYPGFRVGKVRIGLDSVVLPPVRLTDCFMVEVPAQYEARDEDILKIHDIIRMEKPAHTAYYLTFAAAPNDDRLQPFRVGLGRVGLEESGVVADQRSVRQALSEPLER